MTADPGSADASDSRPAADPADADPGEGVAAEDVAVDALDDRPAAAGPADVDPADAEPGEGVAADSPAEDRRPAATRVVIAEDAAILRDGLVELLVNRGFEVVAAVAGPDALRSAVARLEPDVAVVDIRMPPTHTDEGLRAAIDLRRDHPQVGVLVFSQYIETRYAGQLLADRAEGVGYLLKDRVAHVNEFVDALRRVAGGGTVLDPEVVTQLLGVSRRREALATLSPREREVLALMAEGRSNAGIAEELYVSGRAIEKHIANVFTKLDLFPSDQDHRRVLAVLRYLDS